MTDLTTRYLGLDLRSPIVASASPLTGEPDTARRIEDAGAAAVVLPSLFEEEILHEEVELTRALEAGSEHFAEALDYFPAVPSIETAGDRYLARLEAIKARCSVPVIASLNATDPGGWTRYAALIEDAGADALELNLYHVAADPTRTANDVEDVDLAVVHAVRAAVAIPLAVKLSPYYSAMANFARRVVDAGADGLVLFNRFYQPDIDLETLEVSPNLVLSDSAELRLPLRWVAILHGRVDVDFAITSGVHTSEDVIKGLMAGARVTMMASELLKHGVDRIWTVLDELRIWMEEHEYESVEQMQGSMSQRHVAEPSAFERANYMKVLQSWRPDPTGYLLP